MTKAEELKLLEQIEKLIESAGADSYIRMTFAGVPEVCKRNIEDDFGNSPVQDWEEMRNMLCAERVAHDETKRQLADSQNALKEARRDMEGMQTDLEQKLLEANKTITARDAEIDLLKQRIAEAEEERDCMADCLNGTTSIVDEAEEKIASLKAEIMKLRFERMTEKQLSAMYDNYVEV